MLLPSLQSSLHTASAVPAHPLAAPATPDAREAREAAEAELAKAAYRDRASAWEQLWEWLRSILDPTEVIPGAPTWVSWVIVLTALAALVIALVLLLRRVTVARRAHSEPEGLFEADDRDARALTRAADSAAADGRWATAVVERFRAIIRSLDERGLIEDYPGMTAHEAAGMAESALDSLGPELQEAAALFDTVRYGEVEAAPEQDLWMRRLADTITQWRPHSPAPAAVGGAAS